MDEASHAIFLSYASQDAEAARRICAALRAAGLEVWFDQSELRGGDAWDQSIRQRIRDCALFMPVISANTEARGEGYFRLEWRLAVERSHLMADDQAYLVPVVIDGTMEATARVPDRFRERQWLRLPGGDMSSGLVEQVGAAVKRTGALTATRTGMRTGTRTVAATARVPTHRWLWAGLITAVVAVAVMAILLQSRQRTDLRHAAQAPSAPTAVSADARSIAVLPFVNLTGRTEDAYLADGMQEEILSSLARLKELKVISRTSTMEYRGFVPNVREVGHRLGVGSVLEGSVRREGQKLRLTIQLIDTRTDRHLLAASYDRDLKNILGLQSEVAREVAAALKATISGYERGALERVGTSNGDAYSFYLRAVASWRHETSSDETGVAESRKLLEQALRLDPDYTDALALLSQACTWSYFGPRHEVDAECARNNFERALSLDPKLPEGLQARGLYQMYVRSDLDAAIADLSELVRLRPNAAEAHTVLGFALRRKARFDEALVHFARGWDLDPLNHANEGGMFPTLAGLRRLPELIEQNRLYMQRFPGHSGWGYIIRAQIEGRVQDSLEPLRRVLREHADALSADERNAAAAELARAEGRYLDAAEFLKKGVGEGRFDFDTVLRRGLLHLAAGQKREAEQLLRTAERQVRAALVREPRMTNLTSSLAVTQSALGEHAAALETIEAVRAEVPESKDPVNGPGVSWARSVILARAGRTAEAYAEVNRLLRVPFGAPLTYLGDGQAEVALLVKDDPHFDELINNPPRL